MSISDIENFAILAANILLIRYIGTPLLITSYTVKEVKKLYHMGVILRSTKIAW